MPQGHLRTLLLGAAFSFATAAACQASVIYDFEGLAQQRVGPPVHVGNFTYVSPDFVTAPRTVAVADLAYCESFATAPAVCLSATFDPSFWDTGHVQVGFGIGFPGELASSTGFFYFPAGALDHVGIYNTVPGAGYLGQLSVSLSSDKAGVPEPTAWGLMVLGFAGVGAGLRRRGRGALALT